jgi:hypothetical protein
VFLAVDDLLVDFIGEYYDTVIDCDLRDLREVFFPEYSTTRVSRAIYDDEFCFTCDISPEVRWHEILICWNPYSAGARVSDARIVSDPCRIEQYRLVPFIKHRLHRLEDRLLCARSHKNLTGRDIEVVLGAKFLRDRILKFRDAGSRSVMGLSAADRLESRFRDVFGSVKVRLAETHGYHVIPPLRKFGCEFCYRKRCGFLYKI